MRWEVALKLNLREAQVSGSRNLVFGVSIVNKIDLSLYRFNRVEGDNYIAGAMGYQCVVCK